MPLGVITVIIPTYKHGDFEQEINTTYILESSEKAFQNLCT